MESRWQYLLPWQERWKEASLSFYPLYNSSCPVIWFVHPVWFQIKDLYTDSFLQSSIRFILPLLKFNQPLFRFIQPCLDSCSPCSDSFSPVPFHTALFSDELSLFQCSIIPVFWMFQCSGVQCSSAPVIPVSSLQCSSAPVLQCCGVSDCCSSISAHGFLRCIIQFTQESGFLNELFIAPAPVCVLPVLVIAEIFFFIFYVCFLRINVLVFLFLVVSCAVTFLN